MFKNILSAPNPASGAVLSILIGDGLGQGPSCHYDFEELRQYSSLLTNGVSGISRVKSPPL